MTVDKDLLRLRARKIMPVVRKPSPKVRQALKRWDLAVRSAIKEIRQEVGLNQERAGKRLGWSADIMSNVELGRRDLTLPQFIVMAEAWGLNPEVMLRRMLKPLKKKTVRRSSAYPR